MEFLSGFIHELATCARRDFANSELISNKTKLLIK